MSFKVGLNRKEQIQCAKWLSEGVPAEAVAKKFHTSADVVKRFTQEKLDEARAKAQKRTEGAVKAATARKQKASVLKAALTLPDDDEFV